MKIIIRKPMMPALGAKHIMMCFNIVKTPNIYKGTVTAQDDSNRDRFLNKAKPNHGQLFDHNK